MNIQSLLSTILSFILLSNAVYAQEIKDSYEALDVFEKFILQRLDFGKNDDEKYDVRFEPQIITDNDKGVAEYLSGCCCSFSQKIPDKYMVVNYQLFKTQDSARESLYAFCKEKESKNREIQFQIVPRGIKKEIGLNEDEDAYFYHSSFGHRQYILAIQHSNIFFDICIEPKTSGDTSELELIGIDQMAKECRRCAKIINERFDNKDLTENSETPPSNLKTNTGKLKLLHQDWQTQLPTEPFLFPSSKIPYKELYLYDDVFSEHFSKHKELTQSQKLQILLTFMDTIWYKDANKKFDDNFHLDRLTLEKNAIPGYHSSKRESTRETEDNPYGVKPNKLTVSFFVDVKQFEPQEQEKINFDRIRDYNRGFVCTISCYKDRKEAKEHVLLGDIGYTKKLVCSMPIQDRLRYYQLDEGPGESCLASSSMRYIIFVRGNVTVQIKGRYTHLDGMDLAYRIDDFLLKQRELANNEENSLEENVDVAVTERKEEEKKTSETADVPYVSQTLAHQDWKDFNTFSYKDEITRESINLSNNLNFWRNQFDVDRYIAEPQYYKKVTEGWRTCFWRMNSSVSDLFIDGVDLKENVIHGYISRKASHKSHIFPQNKVTFTSFELDLNPTPISSLQISIGEQQRITSGLGEIECSIFCYPTANDAKTGIFFDLATWDLFYEPKSEVPDDLLSYYQLDDGPGDSCFMRVDEELFYKEDPIPLDERDLIFTRGNVAVHLHSSYKNFGCMDLAYRIDAFLLNQIKNQKEEQSTNNKDEVLHSSTAPEEAGCESSESTNAYDLEMTATVSSSLSNVNFEFERINPLLERRSFSNDVVNSLDGIDYLKLTIPALPDGYQADLTFTGTAQIGVDYEVLVSKNDASLELTSTRAFQYSGDSHTIYIVPLNDSVTEYAETIIATLGTPYCSENTKVNSAITFNEITMQATATIVDDDKWTVSVGVTDSIAMERLPNVVQDYEYYTFSRWFTDVAANAVGGDLSYAITVDFFITAGPQSNRNKFALKTSDYELSATKLNENDEREYLTNFQYLGQTSPQTKDGQTFIYDHYRGTIPIGQTSACIRLEPIFDWYDEGEKFDFKGVPSEQYGENVLLSLVKVDWEGKGYSWDSLSRNIPPIVKVEIKDGAICKIRTDWNSNKAIKLDDEYFHGCNLKLNNDDDNENGVADFLEIPDNAAIPQNRTGNNFITVENEDDLVETKVYVWIDSLTPIDSGKGIEVDAYLSIVPTKDSRGSFAAEAPVTSTDSLAVWTDKTKGKLIHYGADADDDGRMDYETTLTTLTADNLVYSKSYYVEALTDSGESALELKCDVVGSTNDTSSSVKYIIINGNKEDETSNTEMKTTE